MPPCGLSNPQLSTIEGNATEPSCRPTFETVIKDPTLCSSESKFESRITELAERPLNAPASSTNPLGSNLNGGLFEGNDLVSVPSVVGKLEFQCSEVCAKRFVMFDHSGGNTRIIFHPALLDEFSLSELSNPLKAVDGMMSSFQGSAQGVDKVWEAPSQNGHNLWSTKVLAFREAMVSAFASFQKMQGQAPGCLANMGADLPSVLSHATCEERKSLTPEHKDGSISQPGGGDSHSLLHENTEDIEALLSSDEECSSTGHSPSALMLDDTVSSCDSRTNCNKAAGSRNKSDSAADETEVNSPSLVSELGDLAEHGCKRVDMAPQSTAGWESPAPSCCSWSTVYSGISKSSSSYMADTPRCPPLKRSKRKHSYTHSNQQYGSAKKRQRRDKIKHTTDPQEHYNTWK
eukprot:c29070_g2_i1 orf=1242-2453(+)